MRWWPACLPRLLALNSLTAPIRVTSYEHRRKCFERSLFRRNNIVSLCFFYIIFGLLIRPNTEADDIQYSYHEVILLLLLPFLFLSLSRLLFPRGILHLPVSFVHQAMRLLIQFICRRTRGTVIQFITWRSKESLSTVFEALHPEILERLSVWAFSFEKLWSISSASSSPEETRFCLWATWTHMLEHNWSNGPSSSELKRKTRLSRPLLGQRSVAIVAPTTRTIQYDRQSPAEDGSIQVPDLKILAPWTSQTGRSLTGPIELHHWDFKAQRNDTFNLTNLFCNMKVSLYSEVIWAQVTK